jgi:hypothetical protein
VTFREVLSASTQTEARRVVRERPGRLVVVERAGPRSIVFQCPCCCGETLTINVDRYLKPWWRLRQGSRGISLIPSVWRTSGCQSHFILWENQILWCSVGGSGLEEPMENANWPEELTRALRRSWRNSGVQNKRRQ